MITRKQYSKEFKLTLSVWHWIREYREDSNGQAFRGNGKLTPEQEEIRNQRIRSRINNTCYLIFFILGLAPIISSCR